VNRRPALRALLNGQAEGESGEELLSLLVRLSTERIWQKPESRNKRLTLGRGRYETEGRRWATAMV